MRDINLHDAYGSHGSDIKGLFAAHEEGFFVPRYQRKYTWEEEQINQFLDDLVVGIRELSKKDGHNATTFLGTVILTNVNDTKETVRNREFSAQPTAIQYIVDGQQRISTISLFAIQLSHRINVLKNRLPKGEPYSTLFRNCHGVIDDLAKLYCVSVPRSEEAPRKPKIIHDSFDDRWTLKSDSSSYNSPVARYLAEYIRRSDPEVCYNSVDPVIGVRVRGNVRLINRWLDDICNAHVEDSNLFEQFPAGRSIASDRMLEYALGYPCEDSALIETISKAKRDSNTSESDASSLHQLFVLSYYLLRRCGVNLLKPMHEEWGFDMFQALNATGTPLTAIETFLPQVMKEEDLSDGKKWESTPSFDSMNTVENLFESTTSNQEKSRRVNELLGAFALCYEGKKLGNKFSAQRWWLNDSYSKTLQSLAERQEYLRYLAQVAEFYRVVWYMEDTTEPIYNALDNDQDGELCLLLIQYLRKASARLVAPILARYLSADPNDPRQVREFTESIKACAAFFTLWRSAHSTAGLDEVYRRFFKGSSASVPVQNHTWTRHPGPIPVSDLKGYFSQVLRKEGFGTCEEWIVKSERFLLYTEIKAVCRFVLFLSGHDRLKDEKYPGLTMQGRPNVCSLLNPGAWRDAKEFKSIEHVAPQSPPDGHDWDPNLYSSDRINQVGNLLLFPEDINNRVGNRSWAEKFFYYQYVGQRRQEDLERIRNEALSRGVNINSKVARMLSKCEFNCAVEPITLIGAEGAWDAAMVDRRTKQMKEIAWSHLARWLGL